MNRISIDTETIRLDQFLKFIAVAQTGGHAKFLIKDGAITVNDEVCLQRGKKLKVDDKIEIEDEGTYIIVNEE